MLGAPNPTPYDLRFSLLGVPVRVHPLFWLISALLGFNPNDVPAMLMWVGVVFVSILVHEMGHALTMRYFGHNPSVVLYAGGGLAMYQSMDSPWSSFGTNYGQRRETPWSKIIISAAGPAAGFVLAGIVIVYLVVGSVSAEVLSISTNTGEALSGRLGQLVGMLLFVNILWGLVNLLPIYPLDGGQIAREIGQMVSPYDGVRITLWISLITAAGVGFCGFFYLGQPFIGIMFAFFAIMNWQMLQGPFGGGGYGGGGGFGGGSGRPW